MLRYGWVRAGDEEPPSGQVSEGRPDLLAVDDSLVTVADGRGGQTGLVGARAGLAEELAPDLLGGEERPEVAGLLARAGVGSKGRRSHAVTDQVERRARRCAGVAQPRVDDRLERAVQPEAAVPLREVDPGEVGIELGAQELWRRSRRRVVPPKESLAVSRRSLASGRVIISTRLVL